MRPLWVEYPTDDSLFSEEQTFLVGKDILVKPVIAAKQEKIDVYFPGKDEIWYDVVDGGKYEGQSKVESNNQLISNGSLTYLLSRLLLYII